MALWRWREWWERLGGEEQLQVCRGDRQGLERRAGGGQWPRVSLGVSSGGGRGGDGWDGGGTVGRAGGVDGRGCGEETAWLVVTLVEVRDTRWQCPAGLASDTQGTAVALVCIPVSVCSSSSRGRGSGPGVYGRAFFLQTERCRGRGRGRRQRRREGYEWLRWRRQGWCEWAEVTAVVSAAEFRLSFRPSGSLR